MGHFQIINAGFVIAAALAFTTGLAHSVLGEILIFSGLRQGGIVPAGNGSSLRERHVRILWATWHLPSIFAILIGVILLEFSRSPVLTESQGFVVLAIVIAAGLSSLLVLVATKGRHPGWVGLLAIAITAWLNSPQPMKPPNRPAITRPWHMISFSPQPGAPQAPHAPRRRTGATSYVRET